MFQKMALISRTDWECSILPCVFPFSLLGLRSSFLHHHCSLPFPFALAHSVLHSLNVEIQVLDQSNILHHHVSLSHLAVWSPTSPHSSIIRCYQGSSHAFLDAWGSWSSLPLQGSTPSFLPSHINPFLFPSPQFYNYHVISSWLATLHLDSFVSGPSFLALPLHLHQQYSEDAIIAASHLQSLQPLPGPFRGQWATDGSCLDDCRSVTSAVMGPQPVILRVSGTNASSIHGEVMALIAAGLVISAHFSSMSHAIVGRIMICYRAHLLSLVLRAR